MGVLDINVLVRNEHLPYLFQEKRSFDWIKSSIVQNFLYFQNVKCATVLRDLSVLQS
jgi:hypothetical protein